MVLWFAGTSVAAVWVVFRDRALDWRVVVLGALLPDVVDLPLGGARIGHSVVTGAVLLAVVMLATRGRRPARKRLLALPMGGLLHLVFDGAWTSTRTFWWPLMGRHFPDRPLPSLDRPGAVVVVQEVLGLVALWWALGHFLDSGEPAEAAPGC